MEISQTIKEKRTEYQLTQKELAEKIFVSKKTISNWETGKTTPDIESLIHLAHLFDLSLDQLLLEGSSIVEDIKKREKLEELTQVYFLGPFITGILLLILLYFGSNLTNEWTVGLFTLASVTNLVPILYFRNKIYQLKGQTDKLNTELKWLTIFGIGILLLIGGFLIYLFTL